MKPSSTTWPRRCQFPLSHHVVGREFPESVLLTTSRNYLVVCCHVPLNVCAEVLERSVGRGIGSENKASVTNSIAPHAARTSPLLSNLRIFQSEQLNPATGPTQRHLAGNCCHDSETLPANESNCAQGLDAPVKRRFPYKLIIIAK